MTNADSSYETNPPLDPASILALGRWLVENQTGPAKRQSTNLGRKATRIGRIAKDNSFNIYNLGMIAAASCVYASKHNYLPESAAALAHVAQGSIPLAYLGAFGAVALAKAAAIAYRDRHSFTDARSRGLGVVDSAKIYFGQLKADVQSKTPNYHNAVAISFDVMSWCCSKISLDKASTHLSNKADSGRERAKEFSKWSAEAAEKALFMTNSTLRATNSYIEISRLILATHFGHFGRTGNAPKLDAPNEEIRSALATGFELSLPSIPDHGSLPENPKPKRKNYSTVDRDSAFFEILTGINKAGLDPWHQPSTGPPTLAELVAICALDKISRYRCHVSKCGWPAGPPH